MERRDARCTWTAWFFMAVLGGCSSSASPGDSSAPDDASTQHPGLDAGDDATLTDASGADVYVGREDGAAPDAAADAGAEGGAEGGQPSNGLFDLGAIRDPSTAACTFSNHRNSLSGAVPLDVWDVSYSSWESIGGTLHPILIRGYAAKPLTSSGPLPAVVEAHGIGGSADEGAVGALSASLGMFVLAYSGPGSGSTASNTSEGLPPNDRNFYRVFDTKTDVRGSWFWGHAAAAMRGLTCLVTRPEVDPNRLGMTGFSGGSMATLIAAGDDDRIKAAVPVSGTGAWDVAAQAPNAWEHALLTQAGLSTTSPEWTRLVNELLAPAVLLGRTRAKIMMLDGTADEFFPLTAFMATYGGIPGDDKRSSFIANYDHGCFADAGVEPSQNIQDRASLRTNGAREMWFNHWFGTNQDYAYLPAVPTATATAQDPSSTLVIATVDPGGTSYQVENVAFWMSGDDALTWGGVFLDPSGGGGAYQKVVPAPLTASTLWFVDVQYKTNNPILTGHFSISSKPTLPGTFVPNIRAQCP